MAECAAKTTAVLVARADCKGEGEGGGEVYTCVSGDAEEVVVVALLK